MPSAKDLIAPLAVGPPAPLRETPARPSWTRTTSLNSPWVLDDRAFDALEVG